MMKLVLMAPLAALVLSTPAARADAIPFYAVQFDATTIALTADGPAGFDTRSGELGSTPVTLSADSVGSVDVATAGAIVDTGLLSTSADVSASGVSSAVASVHFTGSFINGSAVDLNLAFAPSDLFSGSGFASTSLYVSLVSNGVTLFSDYVTGAWNFTYTPAVGSTSVLDLTLSSEVDAGVTGTSAGTASAFGLVAITGTVPEASSWAMFALGLGAVGLHAARRRTAVSR